MSISCGIHGVVELYIQTLMIGGTRKRNNPCTENICLQHVIQKHATASSLKTIVSYNVYLYHYVSVLYFTSRDNIIKLMVEFSTLL